MKYNHNNPEDHTEDGFVASCPRSHGTPVLYATYHLLDWLPRARMWIAIRQRLGSRLQGRCHACPGIERFALALGQGLSLATGCALGLSMDALAAASAQEGICPSG